MSGVIKNILDYCWRRNPVTRIVYSRAHPGLKIIALSLVLVLLSSLPVLACWLMPAASIPYWAALVFAAGAAVAHIGFVVGLAWLIVQMFR